MPGVESYNVSLETQTAEIVAAESLDYETVLEKIKKTGKKVKSGEADGKEMAI
jgi:copper chaperone